MAGPLETALALVSALAAPAALVSSLSTYRDWMRSVTWWRRIRIACVVFVVAAFLANAAYFADLIEAPAPHREVIVGKKFKNETVSLDNREFYSCTFENVTFNWQGGRFKLEAVEFIGAPSVHTSDRIVLRSLQLTGAFSRLWPEPIKITYSKR